MEEKNEIVPVNFKPKASKKFICPKSTQKVAEIKLEECVLHYLMVQV